jgi:hypothetical protein
MYNYVKPLYVRIGEVEVKLHANQIPFKTEAQGLLTRLPILTAMPTAHELGTFCRRGVGVRRTGKSLSLLRIEALHSNPEQIALLIQ